jgi:hypothetical protein
MKTIATQGAMGGIGSKATTELSYSFDGLIDAGEFQYGLNENGIFLLNTGTDDEGVPYTAQFTLNTSDYGIQQEKRVWYLYIAYEGDENFTVSLRCDDDLHGWIDYPATVVKSGLQRVRVQTGRGRKGLMWSVKIMSQEPFKISRISGDVHPLTMKGW